MSDTLVFSDPATQSQQLQQPYSKRPLGGSIALIKSTKGYREKGVFLSTITNMNSYGEDNNKDGISIRISTGITQ